MMADGKEAVEKEERLVNDCRECANFRWDFEAGRFLCEKAGDRQVEDLHIVPAWCPLVKAILPAQGAECLQRAFNRRRSRK